MICLDCSADFRAVVEDLVAAGHLRRAGRLLATAIENRIVTFVDFRYPRADRIQQPAQSRRPRLSSLLREDLPSDAVSKRGPAENRPRNQSIPPIFELGAIPANAPVLAPYPPPGSLQIEPVSPREWSFGQWNRLLPAKATLRALANLIIGAKSGILVEEAAETISVAAWELGDILSELDREFGLQRDQSLAIAFPTSGPKGEASRTRYARHFVAMLNGAGQLSGLPSSLRLINLMENENRIAPTAAGWQFALLENPLLDTREEMGVPAKFSDEEIEFLLNHISFEVHAEFAAFRTLLNLIATGVTTPTAIDSQLLALSASAPGLPLSDAFLSSQRSGAISRMADLDLVVRVRDAVRISYGVTERGEAFRQTSNALAEERGLAV